MVKDALYKQALYEYTPKYPLTGSCEVIDFRIKAIDVEIANYSKEVLNSNYKEKPYIEAKLKVLNEFRTKLKLTFIDKNCVSELEFKKIMETTDILGSEFKNYDQDVLARSSKERDTLLLIGGSIIIAGLVIILSKRK